MRIFLILIFLTIAISSCSKKEKSIKMPPSTEKQIVKVYQEGLEALKEGQYYIASEKFDEAESLLPQTKWAAKSALMSSYCLYSMNYYDEAILNLKRFTKIYPADPNVDYAYYLISIIYYEQILDENLDIEPLLLSKRSIENFLKKYPNTDYAMDLRFKLDLIINQMAAKEISIARYYMKNEKWIPAINRLKTVVEKYEKTVFVEEALHRLVEVYYRLGLTEEARQAASILGYNYKASDWYKRSYKVFYKKYKPQKIKKEKQMGLIRRKIKSLFE